MRRGFFVLAKSGNEGNQSHPAHALVYESVELMCEGLQPFERSREGWQPVNIWLSFEMRVERTTNIDWSWFPSCEVRELGPHARRGAWKWLEEMLTFEDNWLLSLLQSLGMLGAMLRALFRGQPRRDHQR